MEISKAQKLKREAEMRIDEILNALSDETGCNIDVDVCGIHNGTMINPDSVLYQTKIHIAL